MPDARPEMARLIEDLEAELPMPSNVLAAIDESSANWWFDLNTFRGVPGITNS
jgi:hypothetical protein